jgi:hypothetical protein
MPDLSCLLANPADKPFLMNQLLGAETGFPEKMLAYRRTFVRLTDKAARDYTDARIGVLLVIEKQKSHVLNISDGRLLMNLITNKLEDSIITVRRLCNYFDRVKSDDTRFPMDRLFKKQVEALQKSIRDVRDLIVHMDEEISKDTIAAGQPTAPALDETAATITVGETRACIQLRRIVTAANCTPARKFLASLS